MASTADINFMQRALDLAVRARGTAEPNPTVGCVLVVNGQIIGEGHTSAYGGPHAEPNAIADCEERGNDPAGATAYLTLEPCCHTNKRTPPCAPRLVEARVSRVVIGCLDPNPHVDGGGLRLLREAGTEVETGVLEAACRQLVAPFFARMRLNRPYVTLKWAQSPDGKVAGRKGRPVRITNEASTAVVHALRGRCDAIAIGTNTLLNDDPLLTARTPDPPRRPIRVVFSNSLNFGDRPRLLTTRHEGPVLVYTIAGAATIQPPKGVELVPLPPHDNGRGGWRFSMVDAFADLARRGVTHLLIEPGPKLAKELIARNQADRTWIFHGQRPIGEEGLAAPVCPWPAVGETVLGGDRLVEYLNPASEVFFAPAPSADFRLTAG